MKRETSIIFHRLPFVDSTNESDVLDLNDKKSKEKSVYCCAHPTSIENYLPLSLTFLFISY